MRKGQRREKSWKVRNDKEVEDRGEDGQQQ
jgi:hypothetical protein